MRDSILSVLKKSNSPLTSRPDFEKVFFRSESSLRYVSESSSKEIRQLFVRISHEAPSEMVS